MARGLRDWRLLPKAVADVLCLRLLESPELSLFLNLPVLGDRGVRGLPIVLQELAV